MPIIEALLMKAVEKIFSYVITQTGIDAKLRQKLGMDPTKRAFAHALSQSIDQFERDYPEWVAQLFDLSFLENEGAEVIAQFLTPGGNPSASDLANRWANSLNVQQPERRTTYVRELEPVAADFLDMLKAALINEPNLSDLADSRALQQLTNDLSAIRMKLNAEQATPGTRQDYLHWLIERNLYLDARGTLQTERQVQVKLDQVYISLRAQREYAPGTVDRRILEKELTELERKVTQSPFLAEEIEDLREEVFTRLEGKLLDASEIQGEVLELATVISRHDRLVILGDPGSGKSTLLRYLALKHAQALWEGRTEVDADLGPARFPILIRIADYVETGAWREMPLSDFVDDACRLHECPNVGIADLLQTELKQGNCLLMLDGLDEIVSADDRRGVVQRIEDFVRRHDAVSNRFVVTSRIAGYRSAPMGEPFAHYTVQEMNESQIQNFLERWCPAVEASQTPDLSVERRQATARAEIDAIMEAVRSNPGVQRLAANPLLLRTLALIRRTGALLPQKRIELYKLAADTLARTWRTAQGVPESALALVKDEYLNPMLGKLAYWLHANKPTGIATEKEVNAVLGEEWARINGLPWDADDPNPAVKMQVDGFLRSVREHTGLFVERAPKRYGFMHLTFEEYYAARHLVARSKTRAKLIRERLHNARWDEPILLALGFVGLEYPDEAAELLDTAILAEGEDAEDLDFSPSSYEDILGRDFLFALRCLGDNIPTKPARTRKIAERITRELLFRSDSARFETYYRLLQDSLQSIKGSKVAIELATHLRKALDSEETNIRLRAVTMLVTLGETNHEVLDALRMALHDQDKSVRVAAASGLKQSGRTDSEVLVVLLAALRDDNTETRSMAVYSLCSPGETNPEVVSAVLEALHDQDQSVRNDVIDGLRDAEWSNPEVVAALLGALYDEDEDSLMRGQAAISLALLTKTNPEVKSPLLMALHSDRVDIRREVAFGFGVSSLEDKAPDVMAALLEALHDQDFLVQAYACFSLKELGRTTHEAVLTLLEALHDENEYLRSLTASNLVQLAKANPEVLAPLLDALHDESTKVRMQVLDGLIEAGISDPEVVAALLRLLLSDKDAYIRREAAFGLHKLGETNPEVLAALLEALHDENEDTRIRAVSRLVQSERMNSQIVAALLEALHDENERMRAEAASRLIQHGRTDPEVIHTLLTSLHNEASNIRDIAISSLISPDSISPDILTQLLNLLGNSTSENERRKIADLLGSVGPDDDRVLNILFLGLCDPHYFVRTACGRALARLGQRFPESATRIANALAEALHNPEFDCIETLTNRSAHDYAYTALHNLVTESDLL